MGCFNWMIPILYVGNGCFTISIHFKMVVSGTRQVRTVNFREVTCELPSPTPPAPVNYDQESRLNIWTKFRPTTGKVGRSGERLETPTTWKQKKNNHFVSLSRPKHPEIKPFKRLIFPTKHVIPESVSRLAIG